MRSFKEKRQDLIDAGAVPLEFAGYLRLDDEETGTVQIYEPIGIGKDKHYGLRSELSLKRFANR